MAYARLAAVSILFVALFAAGLILLPVTYALLLGIALVAAFILLDARKNRILFVMGRRNLARRKGTTALVVCGLMVGTAIISASFIVGDTLNNMIISETTKGSGGTDFIIQAPGDLGNEPFNGTTATSLESDLRGIDNVRAVQSFVQSSTGVLDEGTQLSKADAGPDGPDRRATVRLSAERC